MGTCSSPNPSLTFLFRDFRKREITKKAKSLIPIHVMKFHHFVLNFNCPVNRGHSQVRTFSLAMPRGL